MELSDAQLLERFPGLPIDLDNKHYYLGLLSHQLVLNKCGDCGTWHRYPNPMCPKCWSLNIVPTAVSGKGSVHLLIFLHQARSNATAEDQPYPIATIELAEQKGLRFTSTIVNCPRSAMRLDMPVQLVWRMREGVPSPVFEPLHGDA